MSTPLQILKNIGVMSSLGHYKRDIIDAVVAQKDVLALLPTGGGNLFVFRYQHSCKMACV